jgi:hypothetical protein
VSLASAPSELLPPSAQPAPSSRGSTGGEHSQGTFERAPRFLRKSEEGSIAAKESSTNAQALLRQAVSTAENVVKSNVGISLIKLLNIKSNVYLFSILSLPVLDTAQYSIA